MSENEDVSLGFSGIGSTDEIEATNTDYEYDLENRLALREEELCYARKEIETLTLALSMLKEFAIKGGLDLVSVGFAPGEKPLTVRPSELTKEQIIERNKLSTQRQAGKHPKSDISDPQPEFTELVEMYVKRQKPMIDLTAPLLEAIEKEKAK